jgi:hypothetical protein
VILTGIALLVESERHAGLFQASRGIDPIYLVENPRGAIERYSGLGLMLLGAWYIRESKRPSDEDPE